MIISNDFYEIGVSMLQWNKFDFVIFFFIVNQIYK